MAASLCSPKPKRLRSKLRPLTAHDGQGLTLAHTAGLRTGCITGRQRSALLRRAHEMNLEFIYMKQALKMPAYEEIVRKATSLQAELVGTRYSSTWQAQHMQRSRNRYYEGPVSEHFDGTRFFNPGQPSTDRGLVDILRWRLTSAAARW